MDKAIAFSIGSLHVHWYGLFIVMGIAAGFLVSYLQCKIRAVDGEKLLDFLVIGIPTGIIGARIYYVIFNFDQYRENLAEIVAVWHGGLAIHGGILAVLITLVLISMYQKINFWLWADIIAPGLVVGQAVGRWGNFANQEAFGYPTSLPWGIFIDYNHRPSGYEQYDFFQPTFLYEILWDLMVLGILLAVSRFQRRNHRLVHGAVLFCYLILYSIGRFWIEGLRMDSEMVGSLRLAQVVSVAVVVLSGLWWWRKQRYLANG